MNERHPTCYSRLKGYFVVSTLLFWCCLASNTAICQSVLTADFDDLSEGIYGTSLSDGGVTFSGLEQNFVGEGGQFNIQTAPSSLSGTSLPNYLGFGGGVADGATFAFGRFGSMNIGFTGMASTATLTILGLTLNASPHNTLTFEAFLNGTFVASQTMSVPQPNAVVFSDQLSVSGVFNSLALVSEGPDNQATSYIGVDNVRIQTVPEPSEVALLSLGLSMALLARRRKACLRFDPFSCWLWRL